jgi:hypothetical protein
MAQIDCKIDKDANGITTVSYTVQRIDLGDELNLITDTPNAALRWNGNLPFDSVQAGEVYPLPHVSASPKTFKVMKAMPLSSPVAECGEQEGDNLFEPWAGAGFPNIGSSQKQSTS